MNYLVTGIAGFVGSSLARAILARTPNATITGIDNLSFGYRERLADLEGRIEFIEGDLQNIQQLLGDRKFDSIVHCAAIAPLPECQRDSHRAIAQNVAICGSVADYALVSGSRDIVFFSSGAIYESTTEFPTPESTTIATSLVYPTTKHMAELYFQAMCRSHGLNVTAIRLFNLYGPHQDYFRKQPPLIGYLLTSLLKDEEAVLFSSGTQSRDYVYIDDLLNLVMASAAKMKASAEGGRFSAVNAGSGHSISVNEIIATLESVSGLRLRVKRMPATQYWDKYSELFHKEIVIDRAVIEREVNKHTLASLDKVQREFDWSAKVDMTEGLRACLAHAKTIIKSY
ncbi:MAG: NAD-dependent epimerase/dehydratase family protein [Rubrivivax sp.]|nr:MAG: NAD-dependent epimerase/dehydratase family protein [Rubrivivax sp.]